MTNYLCKRLNHQASERQHVRTRVSLLFLFLAASVSAADMPGELIDLSRWRLTLPIDTKAPGSPDEIRQPQLLSFVDPEFFYVDPEREAVIFRAPCRGDTTKTSGYPRSELRELAEGGRERAWWSTDDRSIQVLSMKVAVTAVPKVKQHVVCAQIHDKENDLLMVRLEKSKLFIERSSGGDVMLDRRYQLGEPFDLEIRSGQGKVEVRFNGKSALDWKVSRSGCYYKAGCYTQSSPSKGDANDSYGEVAIYQLKLGRESP